MLPEPGGAQLPAGSRRAALSVAGRPLEPDAVRRRRDNVPAARGGGGGAAGRSNERGAPAVALRVDATFSAEQGVAGFLN